MPTTKQYESCGIFCWNVVWWLELFDCLDRPICVGLYSECSPKLPCIGTFKYDVGRGLVCSLTYLTGAVVHHSFLH